jgi:serine/threonine protein kinase
MRPNKRQQQKPLLALPTPDLDDPRVVEALEEYLEATEQGQAPNRQLFLARHPEIAAALAECLDGLEALHEAKSSSRRSDRELPVANPLSPAVSGAPLGDFHLIREIGRGGMGVVYEAEQMSLGRRVALKVLPFAVALDVKQLQRFKNEAQAAALLHHPHIVPVYGVGVERGVHYYAMQLIEGQNLAALVAELRHGTTPRNSSEPASRTPEGGTGSHLPPQSADASSTYTRTALGTQLETLRSGRVGDFFRTVARLLMQATEALAYAHEQGVVHRDIKPANLLVDHRGSVWITDFGLAQFQTDTGLTQTGDLLGTLRYMSPEQAGGHRVLIDHHTDVYSVGATLYEMLTLRPIFDGGDRQTLLNQILHEEPQPPRSVDRLIPVELETIVLKAVAKNPADRYGSARDLADDLQCFLEDRPIQARRPSVAERVRKWMRRHPAFVGAALLFLLVCVIASTVSAVLIAGAQWKTQQAYNQLTIKDKERDQAYEQLAIEQERTKTALEELRAEQQRTRAALETAAEQRNRAERDYEQARRALKMIVQFSEGELAHHPAYQDVRRRLLETVLDYYEEFLARHEDDPAAQAQLTASRERTAVILTELASLRGPSLLALVQDPVVQQDLDLGDEQKNRLDQLADTLNEDMKGFGHPIKGAKPFATASAVENMLGEILSMPQRLRFQQILLQVQQQGRHGFSDPKLVKALNLTKQQRAEIREIQDETQRTWADHVFTDRKICNPSQFWAKVQQQIVAVLEPSQREKWQMMTGPPLLVQLREGYAFDGQNVEVPRPGPSFAFPSVRHQAISVSVSRRSGEFIGSGFGHKRFVDDMQYYCWQGKEIPPTIFEIAVTAQPLSEEERQQLVTKDDPGAGPPASDAPEDWFVLFRSMDPSVWNTDSQDETHFAVPVARAHPDIRYLRLKRLDTGEALIVPITHDRLTQSPGNLGEDEFGWEGSATEAFRARHLGIAQGPSVLGTRRGFPRKDHPAKGPIKDSRPEKRSRWNWR